jgi:HEAT repeat protein
MKTLVLACLCLSVGGYSAQSDAAEGPAPVPKRRSVEECIQALHDKDQNVRHRATIDLAVTQSQGGAAIVPLLDVLRHDESALVRMGAALALGRIARGKPEVVSALVEAVHDRDDTVRGGAIGGLGGMGEKGKPALPTLLPLLRDPNRFLRIQAAEAIAQIDPGNVAAPSVLSGELLDRGGNELLWDLWPPVRLLLTPALTGQVEPGLQPALRACWDRIRFDREIVASRRSAAARALALVPSHNRPIVATLQAVARREDEDERVRSSARDALNTLSLLGRLDRTIGSGVSPARSAPGAATKAGGPVGIPAPLPRPTALTSAGTSLYLEASGLRFETERNGRMLPIVLRSLKDGPPAVRMDAVSLLGQLTRFWVAGRGDEPMRTVRAALRGALQDNDVGVRVTAARGLVRPVFEPGVPEKTEESALVIAAADAGLRAERTATRVLALEVLGDLGPGARAEEPAVERLLTDRNTEVRLSAAEALARIDPQTQAAAPVLAAALKDTDSQIRLRAALRLGWMGDAARGSLPALRAALKDSDALVRAGAAESIWRITDKAEEALPVLMLGLKAPDWSVRSWSSQALGRIGPAAKPAVRALEAALKDGDLLVRLAAATALLKIDPEAAARAGIKRD